MTIFRDYINEIFNDLGKLAPDELKKGKSINEDNFKKVQGTIFFKAITKIKENDIARGLKARGLDTLTVYTRQEYNTMNCYLGTNNSSGYAIHNGNLVSVFSTQGSSGNAIVKNAIKHGAKKLDCFAQRSKSGKISGPLYNLYSKNGFKIDIHLNSGKENESYSIHNGISSFVNKFGKIEPENENVVIFLKL